MIIIKTKEAGYEEAVFGDGLSFGKTSGFTFLNFLNFYDENLNYVLMNELQDRTQKLAKKDRGHDGSLALIQVWLDIIAPRYWWQQMDTYKFKAQRSESTMHTILKNGLTKRNFSMPIQDEILDILNNFIERKEFDKLKAYLPESFLQRRIVSTNYLTLKNIFLQRKKHKLQEWKRFIWQVATQVDHPDLLPNTAEVIQSISDEESKKRQ